MQAIAISHPHYYTSMIEWSHAFGKVPVYVHADDREWVMRPDPVLHFWSGARMSLQEGLTLVRCGGHFPGGCVLHWAQGAGGRGALLTEDIIQVSPDRKSVSFMSSYPNFIPLPSSTVRYIATAVDDFPFEALYGAWWDRQIPREGKRIIEASTDRYIRALDSKRE